MFKQCLERKEETKEDHIRHGKSLSRIILIHQGMPKSPWPVFIRPKGSHRNTIKSLTQAITRARKEKGPKCTTHFRCPMENCSPYWFRTMEFLSFLQDQEDLHIRKDTILMSNVSTTKELEGIPQKIARLLKIKSNHWSTRIQRNSEDLLMVIKSIKIKDQLRVVLVRLLIMNVRIRECAFWEM